MLKYLFIGSVIFASALASYDVYANEIPYNVPLPISRGFTPYGHHISIQTQNGQRHIAHAPVDDLMLPTVATAAVKGVAIAKVGLISKTATFALSLAKIFITFILRNGLALVIGSLAALGVCKFTSICNKLSSLHSIVDLQKDLTQYATPERIALATEFLQKSIRDYRSIQN